MNPGEVLAMDAERALVFTPRTNPIRLKTYTWKDFVEEMKIPPPRREPIKVDEDIFSTCNHAERQPEWQKDWKATNPTEELNYIEQNIMDSKEPQEKATTKQQPVEEKPAEEIPKDAQPRKEPDERRRKNESAPITTPNRQFERVNHARDDARKDAR